jgi:HAMP domain-containing protein
MKMKIRTRMAFGFVIMLLLVLVTAAVGIMSVSRIVEAIGTVSEQADQSAALGSIHADITSTESFLLLALENRTAVTLMTGQHLLEKLSDDILVYEHPTKPEGMSMSDWSAANPQAAESCAAHCHEGATLMALEERRVAFTKVAEEYLAQAEVQAVNMPRAQDSIGSAAEDLRLAADAISRAQVGALSRVETTAGEIESTTRTLMLVAALVAAVLGILLAVSITRSVTVPLAHLVKVSDKISTGELDTPVPAAAKDEIGELAEAMERMRVSVKTLVERMRSRGSD